MPVHASEENAPEGITEMIAKDPSSNTESTSSSHEMRMSFLPHLRRKCSNNITLDQDKNEHQSKKASAQDFQSKGPVIPQNMDDLPPKASKEELKARAAELNDE